MVPQASPPEGGLCQRHRADSGLKQKPSCPLKGAGPYRIQRGGAGEVERPKGAGPGRYKDQVSRFLPFKNPPDQAQELTFLTSFLSLPAET